MSKLPEHRSMAAARSGDTIKSAGGKAVNVDAEARDAAEKARVAAAKANAASAAKKGEGKSAATSDENKD